MLLGAIATAGLLVSVAGVLMRSRDQTSWFAIAMILNLPAGVWWLGVLPHGMIWQFMGGDAGATLVLAAGISCWSRRSACPSSARVSPGPPGGCSAPPERWPSVSYSCS